MQGPHQSVGVVVVAFNSSDVILDCVESLLNVAGGAPRIVVVDNASSDDTVGLLRRWASGKAAYAAPEDLPFTLQPVHRPVELREYQAGETPREAALGAVTLVHSGVNRGFAGGVNIGLEFLAKLPEIQHFWVLNPDAMAAPDAVDAILARAAEVPGYALMGGRVCYAEPPYRIQIDGGRTNRWTGVSGNFNLGGDPATTPQPRAEDLDFITGASMVASRAFYEAVGPMREDYFLYYEEVDWAFRRGAMPLVQAPRLIAYHKAGTSIGSPTLDRMASPFSIWFKHRGRMRFVRRFNPLGLPVAWAYGMAKAAQMVTKRAWPQADAILRATNGLPAPRAVRERLSPEAARIAFGRPGR